jgi:hypothetical protein
LKDCRLKNVFQTFFRKFPKPANSLKRRWMEMDVVVLGFGLRCLMLINRTLSDFKGFFYIFPTTKYILAAVSK